MSALPKAPKRSPVTNAPFPWDGISASPIAEAIRLQERSRIAMDIHDGPAQTLSGAIQLLQALAYQLQGADSAAASLTLARALTLLRQSSHQLRQAIQALPTIPVHGSLVAALRRELQALANDSGLRVSLQADHPLPIAPDLAQAVYPIVHEAITNANRHAQSPALHLSFRIRNGWLFILVRDWGRGFDPAHSSGPVGSGLTDMQLRAQALGGRCRIRSALGHGARVLIAIPCRRHSDFAAPS